MQRKPFHSPRIFVVPLSGVEIVYLSDTGEIQSLLQPADPKDDGVPGRKQPTGVEAKKKSS